MPNNLIEDVIAIRRFYLASEQGTDREVIVAIGRPQKHADFDEYRSPIRLEALVVRK